MTDAEDFKAQVMRLAVEIGVQPREIHIRPMTRKWGSCSSLGRLSFSKSLLEESARKQYEVILHELLHLRYPNHGKMFKRMMDAYLSRGPESSGAQSE